MSLGDVVQRITRDWSIDAAKENIAIQGRVEGLLVMYGDG